MSQVRGVILCGGRSSRMGYPKYKLKFHGKTLLKRAIELFKEVNLSCTLSINREQEELLTEYDCVIDTLEEQGPLGGIFTALEHLNTDIIVIPIDMPGIEVQMIQELSENQSLSAFEWETKVQPFPSYWPKHEVAQLKKTLAQKKLSVIHYLKGRECKFIHGKHAQQFKNLNESKDLI